MNFFLSILLTLSNLQSDSLVHTLDDEKTARIQRFQVLPDQGYSIETVSSDTSLVFKESTYLQSNLSDKYWIKLQLNNTSAYSKDYYLWLNTIVENVLYQYDQDQEKWISHPAGFLTPSGLLQSDLMPMKLSSNAISTVFISTDISHLKEFEDEIKAWIYIHKEEKVKSKTQLLTVIWMVALGITTVLFLYNGYIYLFFRDKTYVYYLLLLIGGIIYITGLHGFFHLIIPWNYSTFFISPSGVNYFYEVNTLLIQLGIICVIGGFIMMTRSYLNTKEILPTLDKILKITFYFFILMVLIPAILSFSGLFFLEYYTNKYLNLLIISIILLLYYTGFAANRKSFKPAKYYLIAHSVPLVFILMLTVYFLWFQTNASDIYYLPSLAIITQALTFAIALVARMQLLKDELSKKKLELRLKKVENEKLQDKLDYNNREIATSTMYQCQRNEMLLNLKGQVDNLTSMLDGEAKGEAKKIKSAINSSITLTTDWEKFKLHFAEVHPDFFKNLKAVYPNLTQNEIRLSAYFHINLSVKEIAALTNISPESVRKAKTRLNKKLRETEVMSS
jgi:hypothetical protein